MRKLRKHEKTGVGCIKEVLVACAIYIKRHLRKKNRFLVREIFKNREEKGEFRHMLHYMTVNMIFGYINTQKFRPKFRIFSVRILICSKF